jgi:hypothetical protein
VRRSAVVGLVVVLAVAAFAGVAAAQSGGPTSGYGGEPSLDAYAPSPTVSPGDRGQFTIQVANDGEVTEGIPPTREAVTTARNVRVDVDADGTPLSVRSGARSIGSVTENQPRSVPIQLEVPSGVEPGTYDLEVELEYAYTDRVYPSLVTTSEASRTVTRTVSVVVEDGPRFSVRTLATDAQVGGSGTTTVEVENVGTETAREVTVQLTAESQQLTFDAAPTARAAVGSLAPGESSTVEYGVDVAPGATRRSYPVAAAVSFEDEDGFAGLDDRPSLQVTPLAEQTVSVVDVESPLRVAEEGTLQATVVNEGPADLTNAVVTLRPPSGNVNVIEPEVAIGDLAAGESTDVSFDVEVATAARAGSRQFTLATEYEDAAGETRAADPVRFRAPVGPERDAFGVDTGSATVTAGGSSRITMRVTNRLDEPVTDVSAKLFASSPLSADDDEAYVASLEPGETVEIPFRVAAAGAALPKDYPISVDFQYVDDAGETRLSDSYRRPVTLVESSGGLFGFLPPIGFLAAGAVVVPLALAPLRRL